MSNRALIALIGAILLSGALSLVAHADAEPDISQRGSGCAEIVLCDAQTAEADACDTTGDGDGNELVLPPTSYQSWTFYAEPVTASAFVCDIESNTVGYDASAGAGYVLNSANGLTETNRVRSLSGVFQYLWIECSDITGGAVTIKAYACE